MLWVDFMFISASSRCASRLVKRTALRLIAAASTDEFAHEALQKLLDLVEEGKAKAPSAWLRNPILQFSSSLAATIVLKKLGGGGSNSGRSLAPRPIS